MSGKKRLAHRSRNALLVTIGALGAVPIGTGLLGILGGPERAPGGAVTTPSVDSEYRFANMFWLSAGVLLWWTLRKPEERADVTRVVLGIAASGGFARLLSVAKRASLIRSSAPPSCWNC